jgi:hypothetical protein
MSYCLKGYGAQRFSALRSGGISAQKFNRRTALEPTTKLLGEALNPPLRKTDVSGSLFFLVHSFLFRNYDVIVV